MMLFVVLLISLAVYASAVPGWTYQATTDACLGTTASPCGQEFWGKVNGLCAPTEENFQSPINIAGGAVVPTKSVPVPHYKAVDGGCKVWSQFTNEYVFEVSFGHSGCNNLKLSYDGEDYTMAQIHFHSPAEHTIGGGYHDAEAHFVHTTAEGKTLVLGIFLDANAAVPDSNNWFLDHFWHAGGNTNAGIEAEVEVETEEPVNPYDIITPGRPGLYTYDGSLTVPPCTAVKWFVFDEAVKISAADLGFLRGAVAAHEGNLLSAEGNNNRYPQLLNNRTIFYTTGSEPAPSMEEEKERRRKERELVRGVNRRQRERQMMDKNAHAQRLKGKGKN